MIDLRKYKFNKRTFSTICLLIMLITVVEPLLTGCSGNTKYILTTGFGRDEIMRIGDDSCSTQEALLYLASIKNEYTDTFGQEIWSVSNNGVTVEDNIKDMVLGRIIKIKVMNLMAADMNVQLDDDMRKQVEARAKEYYDSLPESEKKHLGNIEYEDVRQYYMDMEVAELLYQELTNDVNAEISDDEARTVVVKQIFISYGKNDVDRMDARSKAEEVSERLQNGESFDKLLGEYSDLGEQSMSYQKGDLDDTLETCIFNMGKDEVSKVLEGLDGYYIMYCVNPNDLSVTDVTKAEIIEERKKVAFDEKYQRYFETVTYYINDEAWEKLNY